MRNILFIIIGLIALNSCEKRIPIDIEQQDPKIVINALFDNTKKFTASISKSVMIDDVSGTNTITNAIVKLYENDVLLDTLSHTGGGVYMYNDTLQPGNSYELIVACDLGTASATATMPEVVPIISVDSVVQTQIVNDVWGETWDALMVYYTFQDLPGDQYYSLKLIVNAELESLGSYNVGDMFYYEYNYRTSSSGIDGSSSVDLYSYLRFSDGLFNEELKTYKFGVMYDPYNLQYYLENNYQFKLQFYSLNENFYTYLQTLEAYYNAEGDFFAESINLFSNVEGGLGIFAGAVLSEVDVDLSGIVTTKSENK